MSSDRLPVNFDHNATTPVDPRVLDAMLPYFREQYGNPSSGHSTGQQARNAVARAREQVAALVNAHPSQVIFTSGGTEANNLALKGIAAKRSGSIAISAIEHASIIGPAELLQSKGYPVRTIGVDANGRVTREQIQQVIANAEPAVSLLSVMMANNETGVVQNIAELMDEVRHTDVIVHTDAVQALGKMKVDFKMLGVHMMSLSAHKIYGPKGVGALVVDKAVDLESLLQGGGQERGYRAGTENVAGIVGFGEAAELASTQLASRSAHMMQLRLQLEAGIKQALPKAIIFAVDENRLCNTVFMSIPGIDGETLLINLDQAGIAISSGSACESASLEPSHVLMAMGVDNNIARCAIRVSLGKDSTPANIEYFIQQLKQHVAMLQSMAVVMSG